MTNLDIIKLLKESTFTDESSENYQLDFKDGLSESEIEELKIRFPNHTINSELIEILKETIHQVRLGKFFGKCRMIKQKF